MSIRLHKKANKITKPTAPVDHTKPDHIKVRKASIGSFKSKEFFTAAELALRWGMSQRHVRPEIASGGLRMHRFGKAVRVSIADVLVYEASRIQVI